MAAFEYRASDRSGSMQQGVESATDLQSAARALRARGLGSAWTTLHLMFEEEAARLLHVPDNLTQCALLPVAYFTGDDDLDRPACRNHAGHPDEHQEDEVDHEQQGQATQFSLIRRGQVGVDQTVLVHDAEQLVPPVGAC